MYPLFFSKTGTPCALSKVNALIRAIQKNQTLGKGKDMNIHQDHRNEEQAYTVLAQIMNPGAMLFFTGSITVIAALAQTVLLYRSSSITRSILLRVIRNMLRLRYDIEVIGMNKVKHSSGKKEYPFLPNHPAWIDTIPVLGTSKINYRQLKTVLA